MPQAKASDSIKPLLPREKKQKEYQDKLKDRFKDLPEVPTRIGHIPGGGGAPFAGGCPD